MPPRQADAAASSSRSIPTLYLVAATWLVLAVISFGLLLSFFVPVAQLSDISHIFGLQRTLASLAADDHYKYLLPLLIPTTCWFAIANWVGWEYFRFA